MQTSIGVLTLVLVSFVYLYTVETSSLWMERRDKWADIEIAIQAGRLLLQRATEDELKIFSLLDENFSTKWLLKMWKKEPFSTKSWTKSHLNKTENISMTLTDWLTNVRNEDANFFWISTTNRKRKRGGWKSIQH